VLLNKEADITVMQSLLEPVSRSRTQGPNLLLLQSTFQSNLPVLKMHLSTWSHTASW